jgi:hypothetical protein
MAHVRAYVEEATMSEQFQYGLDFWWFVFALGNRGHSLRQTKANAQREVLYV